MRTDTPRMFLLLIKLAIQLDKRIYQQHKEKQGKQPPQFILFKKTSKTVTKKPYYGPMPIEINTTQKQLSERQQPKKAVKGNCYNCGKPGHYSKQCCLPQKPRNGTTDRSGSSTRTIAAINQDPKNLKITQHDNLPASCCWMANCQDHSKETSHNALSWTACYNDLCPTHMSDKEGLGWFPKKPRIRPLREIISECVLEEVGIIEEEEAGTTQICSIG